MVALFETDDLINFATINEDKANDMISDAIAKAKLVAPCLSDPDSLTEDQLAAVKAVLRAAILRWNESGTGAVSSQTMGPFSVAVDTRQQRRDLFWPSEIADLQRICREVGDFGGAFDVDTAAASAMTVHPILGGWHSTGWGGSWGGWNDNGTYIPPYGI